jgi:hypothetical protein
MRGTGISRCSAKATWLTPASTPQCLALACEDVASVAILLIALFVGMVVVAGWAWVVAPRERRFPIRAGNPPWFDGTLGKRTGLLLWVALGAMVMTGSLMAEADTESDLEALLFAGVALLAFLLLMEIVSVRRLMR